ncbi:MAG TPA: threonine/serine exporter, partial [Clostridium sp.]|nr:threonine/serine exporter [Clostridium sp.]
MDDIRNELKYIDTIPRYSDEMTTFMSGLSAGFFTLLFGGALRDFLVSAFIGIVISLIIRLFNKYQVNSFFS